MGGGNFEKSKIEIWGSGWRGWVDLIEAVWTDEKSDHYALRRNSKLPGQFKNLKK